MKAIVIDGPDRIELRDVEKPACGPDDVLIRSATAGLCRTDLEILRGEVPEAWLRYPVIPGHEWSGTIDEVGANVTDYAPGDRVCSEGIIPCNRCRRCRNGDTNLCENYDQLGFTRGGGCGEYVLAPQHVVHRLGDGVSFDSAVLVEPASVVLRAIERCLPRLYETVGVVGIGTLGSIALQILSLFGPRTVVAYGVRDEELDVARRMGATHTVNVARQDAEEETRRLVGEGLDMVVEVAGSAQAVETALNVIRMGGRVSLLGIAGHSARLEIPSDYFVVKDVSVIGGFSYTSATWTRMLALVNGGLVNLDPIVTHRFPTADFATAYELMDNRGDELVAKIVLDHEHATSA